MAGSRIAAGKADASTSPARKPGRPFKPSTGRQNVDEAVADHKSAMLPVSDRPPPSIPYRAFKVALASIKERGAIPEQIDRSIWTNQLFGQDLHGMLEACQFLGLTDAKARPTTACKELVASVETEAWSVDLRKVLETAYAPLLASRMSSLTAGGLLQMFRRIYKTPNGLTRKCCSFFVHAGREAAMDIGPFLLTNSRSRWVGGKRVDRRDDTLGGSASLNAGTRTEALSQLAGKLPDYDATWPDDMKRLWFGAFSDLLQRFDE